MMHFKVSAPGKVILYGEHAVVYSKTAIAASLDIYTTLEYKSLPPSSHGSSIIILNMPKISLKVEIPIEKIMSFFFSENSPIYNVNNHDIFYNHVQTFVERVGYANNQQKTSLTAFFYLFIGIGQLEHSTVESFELTIDSGLTINSGLGSSASFSVCIAACSLHLSHLQKKEITDLNSHETLHAISVHAMNCEKIMHGTPSGIDNTICTYGSMIEFKKNEKLKLLAGAKTMKILLIDTRVPRSTKTLIDKLSALRAKHPEIFVPVMDAIDSVSKDASGIIERIKLTPNNKLISIDESYKELMTLMEINQGLLVTCQVSHPSLDRICAEAKNYGLAAKLTGAGGGGFAYILLFPDTPTETITSISKKLIANGYLVTLTNLGGPGVRIHAP